MGTKFANLHIKTSNQEVILNALQWLSDNAKSIITTPDYSEIDIIDRYVYRTSTDKQIKNTVDSVSFYLNAEMNWTSILNDQFSWGTVEDIGELLSTVVSKPVMTIGFFDEDIFEFTLFQEGEIKTKKYFCEDWVIEEFELGSEEVDLNYLEKTLETNQEEINKLLEIRDPEQAIDVLSRIINKNLWVHSEWISHNKEIEEKYKKLELKL